MDVGEVLGANRLEGAEADVEGHVFDLHPLCLQSVEDLRSEVEAGGGGSGGARLVGVDRLVAVAVLSLVLAMDVRRQRRVAYFVEDRLKIGDWGEAQDALPEVGGAEDLSLKEQLASGGIRKVEAVAGLDLAAG